MSRAWTFVGIVVVLIVTIWVQRLTVDLLGPSSALWQQIAAVEWPVDGDVWAERMYVAISVWFIWIIRVGVVVAGFYREFTRQNVTAARARRGPP